MKNRVVSYQKSIISAPCAARVSVIDALGLMINKSLHRFNMIRSNRGASLQWRGGRPLERPSARRAAAWPVAVADAEPPAKVTKILTLHQSRKEPS